MKTARNRFILLVTACYTVLALAWIFLSDLLLAALADIESMRWLSTAKGVFFVAASAAGFFFALRAVPAAGTGEAGRLLDTLAAGLAPGRMPSWAGYAFALAAPLAMVLVRESLAIEFGDRPLLILFMLPIALSALLGGIRPGLLATAVSALGVAWLTIPPVHDIRIHSPLDRLQWGFLIVNGVVLSMLSEVLRRALAKAELHRRLLDSVVSGTRDAIFVKDTQGRYLLANAATAGFVGKPVEEIVGRDDRALFPPETAQALMATDRTLMAAGRTQTHEEPVTTLDGRALVFLVTKGPVFDNAGEVVGLFGISHEIGERKRAEDEIRDLNIELERRVAARTAELQSANRELEDLAYALTHNLRAPLRAIGGFSQLLIEDHAGMLNDEARDCLQQIVRSGADMGELLDGILALLRCTRGELQRETVDVSALAQRRLDALRRGEPQRRVACEVAANLSAVGDPAMLDVVLTQLIDNAWKFTGGRADALIRVAAGTLDGTPGVCVSDNGAGFDMDHAERLFQPFQRLHRQDEFPGIGIGLAAVQRIVRRHGGEIRATGAPGQGASFCFSLPGDAGSTGDRR